VDHGQSLLSLIALFIKVWLYFCSLSVSDDDIAHSSIDEVAMATADSATHTDFMDTVNDGQQSVVSATCDYDIQDCLQWLFALG